MFNLDDGQIFVTGASQYAAPEPPDFADDTAPVTGVIVGVKAILPRANLDAWHIGFLLL